MLAIGPAACSGKRTNGEEGRNSRPTTPKQQLTLKKAQDLIEKGYERKKTGHNRSALNLFEQAETLISSAVGKESEEYASILDDEATVLLRTGDYQKSRVFYQKASAILKEIGKEEGRLAQGIQRRLNILDALEKNGILCNEPLAPPEPKDAGDAGHALPYFPELEEVHAVFSRLNQHLGGCAKQPIGSTPIRVVLTGNGRIIVAEARHLEGTPPGNCLEKKILQAAKGYVSAFPKFEACFRNFTFPFVPD